MNIRDKYFHWFWGDNNIRNDKPQYIGNMDIGVLIRFDASLSMSSDYDTFYKHIADVQFIHGKRPNHNDLEHILTEAWNYLCIEERILDDDLEDIEDHDF